MATSWVLLGFFLYSEVVVLPVKETKHGSEQLCIDAKKKMIDELTHVEGRGIMAKTKGKLLLSCIMESAK